MNGIAAVEGAGSARVLVLHGWALDSGIWLTTRALTDQATFTYAYFDFPGYGSNRQNPPAANLDEMATLAIAAADSLGWDTFSVLGHSMGGATAIQVAALAPERVTAVVALTPVSPQGTPFDQETYDAYRSAWADPVPALSGLAPHVTPAQMQRIAERNRATMSQPVWEQYLANWSRGTKHAPQIASDVPITLVYGESDPFVTSDYIDGVRAGLPHTVVKSVANAGHYPMIETPEESVQIWESALVANQKKENK